MLESEFSNLELTGIKNSNKEIFKFNVSIKGVNNNEFTKHYIF